MVPSDFQFVPLFECQIVLSERSQISFLKLTIELEWYKEQFRLLQQKRFGSSSEKTNPDQLNLSLFNEAEIEADPNRRRGEGGSGTSSKSCGGWGLGNWNWFQFPTPDRVDSSCFSSLSLYVKAT